ncbi:MAG: helix-turn-helix domain-containing protein [Parvibaculum sp.]|uniref:TetR/AcrR family transcriptional regulator n=1 Tax=Parvibaculum sp. TaxID=2024848 RepID=UPI00271683FF|nr:TetR/AcrR family transcriptional regulator [Parvibaculum sp.]MDO8838543.1 helix-turn-helix domain-containing protein [Parvibaculum sp.]
MVTTTSTRPKPRPRDRAGTEGTILDAVSRLILRDGLSGVGINALAREAGVDKVLIYRYFGDLDGLYRAYAEHGDFWWTVEEMLAATDGATDAADALKRGLRHHAAAMRQRPVTLAVIAAEPTNRTALVVALEEVREKRSIELMEKEAARHGGWGDVDIAAVTALLAAAIDYLAARALRIRVYGGVEIKTNKDWERVLATVDAMIDGVFMAAFPSNPKEKS